jgi:hypothetical protein
LKSEFSIYTNLPVIKLSVTILVFTGNDILANMNETLSVHTGDQAGNAWWELSYLEHGIGPDDQFPLEKDVQGDTDSISSFLSETPVATAFCTSDPSSESNLAELIFLSSRQNLYYTTLCLRLQLPLSI